MLIVACPTAWAVSAVAADHVVAVLRTRPKGSKAKCVDAVKLPNAIAAFDYRSEDINRKKADFISK